MVYFSPKVPRGRRINQRAHEIYCTFGASVRYHSRLQPLRAVIARGPNDLAPPEKAKGYYPIAFALSSSTASCKAITSTGKPSRSAAELYGERQWLLFCHCD